MEMANTKNISGIDIHYLNLDELRDESWRPRLVRGLGERLISHGAGLWNFYLTDIWPDFLWNVRCFDPDVIDLRWMRGKNVLEPHLRNRGWRVIARGKNIEAKPVNWRIYDPNQKVSVVLPVYNGAAYVRQSIESCLAQTHSNIELVIVDDCSTDDTPSIIAEYARRDPRIIALRNEKNKRLPGTLNVGFAATSGKLLTWTSHDNYYAPTAIETMVRYLCTWQDMDLVYSAYHMIDADGTVQPRVNYLPPPWRLRVENVVGAYFMYRRRVYEGIGGYREDMEYIEDYEYWVRVYKNNFKMMRLHEPLYFYRRHADSMTTRAKKMEIQPWEKVRHEHFQVGST